VLTLSKERSLRSVLTSEAPAALPRAGGDTGVFGRHPLIFIRHGETDWNRTLRLQGQRDIPMNAFGCRQAARNGRALAGILAKDDWQFVASPLARSVETMRIVLASADRSDAMFATDARLMELTYGDWEGLTLPEVAKRDPDAMRRRDTDKWNYVPPAGESYAMLAERVSEWLMSLRAPSLIVAHGGTLRVLLHNLAGLPSHDAPHLAVPQDRVVLFTRELVVTI
jgi:broad specificity phosphatase PhoE